jgi:hypothetical protein
MTGQEVSAFSENPQAKKIPTVEKKKKLTEKIGLARLFCRS